MSTTTQFLTARVADDERWANAATKTPGAARWHWVDSDTDQPIALTPDGGDLPDAETTDRGVPTVSLRSVEEFESNRSPVPMPDFVIWAVEVDAMTQGVAGHVARHDPHRTLAYCEAVRNALEIATGLPDEVALALLRPFCVQYAEHPDYRPDLPL